MISIDRIQGHCSYNAQTYDVKSCEKYCMYKRYCEWHWRVYNRAFMTQETVNEFYSIDLTIIEL